MKWVLLVAILYPDGNIDKIMNSASGWEDRSQCLAFAQEQQSIIVESISNNFYIPEGSEILGIGCFQPQTNQEDMIVVFD